MPAQVPNFDADLPNFIVTGRLQGADIAQISLRRFPGKFRSSTELSLCRPQSWRLAKLEIRGTAAAQLNMASEEDQYHPKDAVKAAINGTLIVGAAGAMVSAVQNTLTKRRVGAWGVITRTGSTIATFGTRILGG